jgi:hypothetical protein
MTTAFDLGCFAADALIEKSAGLGVDIARVAVPAALGAGFSGMVGGLLPPGHVAEKDSDGKLIVKPGSRFKNMLRGAGYGAIAGGGIGGISLGTNKLLEMARAMVQDAALKKVVNDAPTIVARPRQTIHFQRDANGEVKTWNTDN